MRSSLSLAAEEIQSLAPTEQDQASIQQKCISELAASGFICPLLSRGANSS